MSEVSVAGVCEPEVSPSPIHQVLLIYSNKKKRKSRGDGLVLNVGGKGVVRKLHAFVTHLRDYLRAHRNIHAIRKFSLNNVSSKVAELCSISHSAIFTALKDGKSDKKMDYTKAKGTKLKLKGVKAKPAHKKKKRKAEEGSELFEQQRLRNEALEDASKHGGWWNVKKFDEISGCVAIEFGEQSYVKCLDDGTFALGAPHNQDEPPSPEEIFTAIRINDDKIALKSGYGKYLGVDKDGGVIGRADAVGAAEQWEPIFQEGKLALLGHNRCFMSIDLVEDAVIARNITAGPTEVIRLRCQTERTETTDDRPVEEKGNIKAIELNYVKKFQKFEDKRIRMCTDDVEAVKKAQEEGCLHESLLDRRAKMKADRYCK